MTRTAKHDVRRLLIPATGTLAGVLIVVELAFMIRDAESTNLSLSSFKGSAKAAAVLDAGALCATLVLTTTRTLNIQPRKWVQSIPGWIGGLLALASCIITLNVLILKKINPKLVDNSDRSIGVSTEAELAVWALATAAQLAFYAVFAFAAPLAPVGSRSRSGSNASPLATLEKKSSRSDRPALPQAAAFPASQVAADATGDRRASWRNSLASFQQKVRPTPLPQERRLLQQSIDSTNNTARSSVSRDEIRSYANSRSGTPDGLACDLSAPATQTRDITNQGATVRKGGLLPVNGTMLPTIPGSRPTSQGNVLDEPFEMVRSGIISFASDQTKDSFDVHRPASEASLDKFSLERVRDLSDRPMSALSSTSTITLPDNFPPRPDTSHSTVSPEESRPSTIVSSTSTATSAAAVSASTPASRPSTAFSSHSAMRRPVLGSRPSTPSVHEAHIHPLFRADSPVPPPVISANTTITASTFSGQTIGQVIATPPRAHRAPSPLSSDVPSTIPSRSQSQSHGRASSRSTSRSGGAPSSSTPPRASSIDAPHRNRLSRTDSTNSSPRVTPEGALPIPDFILSVNNERLK